MIRNIFGSKNSRFIKNFCLLAICVIISVIACGCTSTNKPTASSPESSSAALHNDALHNDALPPDALAPAALPIDALPPTTSSTGAYPLESSSDALPIDALPTTVHTPNTPLSTDIIVTRLVGYWANIFRASDGIDHLEGFYFAEDGTGLVFHASEGSFLITSYRYSDDGLLICFLNMEDEPVEWLYQIESVRENKLVLSNDYSSYAYEQMVMIEPYNSLGGYTVTQADGVVFDIVGYSS